MTTAIAGRTAPHHDTLTCYTDYSCRLPACVERVRAYEKRRRDGQAAGTWQPYIDATPVREHLLQLYAAGVTVFRAATLTGLSDTAVRGFTQQTKSGNRLVGRRHRVTPEIAAKILAIDPAKAAPTRVDSTGSRRRVQALVAIGWPLKTLADHTGISYSTLYGVTIQPVIFSSTAAAVTAAYEQYKHRPPTRRVVSARQFKMARARAASHGWPTPTYWDATGAIDDPDFEPAYNIARAQEIAEDAHWLMTMGGLTKEQAADRLGRSHTYVKAALRDHPQDDEAAA